MNNPVDLYLRHLRHIRAMLQSLQDELEGHQNFARTPEQTFKIWVSIGELAVVEDLLKAPLFVLSGMTKGQVEAALKEYDDQVDNENGGYGDE